MSLIDLAHFENVALNNPKFALEIITRFLNQASGYRKDLKAAMATGDFWSIKQTFQNLKAQALVFGAQRLVQQIRRIEIAPISRYEEHRLAVEEAVKLFEELLEGIEEVKPIFVERVQG